MTSQEIPTNVLIKLSSAVYARPQMEVVSEVLAQLGVEHRLFRQFMERFEGPFWNVASGYELLDLVEGNPNVMLSTVECRAEFDFPTHYLVLTALSANQIIILDSLLDYVYEVDFEGGDKLFADGMLEPRWRSYSEFLNEYFRTG